MKNDSQEISHLSKWLDRVVQTPASFAFYVAIHDFVQKFEAHASFSKMVLPAKYPQLKEVYQGIEDTQAKPGGDLGHDRYMNIQALLRIRENDVSDNNSFWKKREVLRTIAMEMYELLGAK